MVFLCVLCWAVFIWELDIRVPVWPQFKTGDRTHGFGIQSRARFAVALTMNNILFCLIGCIIGTAIGVLPGIGPVATISLLLPITCWRPPRSSCSPASTTARSMAVRQRPSC